MTPELHYWSPEPRAEPAPIDLLIPVADARADAVLAAAAGNWLDAFLLVAGCTQVVEDHLHGSESLLDRISSHVASQIPRGEWLARPVKAVASARRVFHERSIAARRLLVQREALLSLACSLCDAYLQATPPSEQVDRLMAAVERQLGPRIEWHQDIDVSSLRMPSCFRSFDQHPADVIELVHRFSLRWPDRSQPVLVAGIRTSGSYMGPLAAAALRRDGYRCVQLVTPRPGERLDTAQRAAARAVADGRCVVIDDPPVSGAAMQSCIQDLTTAGVPAAAMVLLLALPDHWPIPSSLESYERVVVPGMDWHITKSLTAEAVTRVAGRLLARSARQLEGPLTPVADPVGAAPGGMPRTPREHRRAAFAATVGETVLDVRPPSGDRRTLLVQGVGIGLFGRHDSAVAGRLGSHVPEILGVHDGLLYQLVASSDPAIPPLDVQGAVTYLADRHRALLRPVDRSASMHGRMAAWEVAGLLVGKALGRPDLALRIPVVHPLVRLLLSVDQPSVVDGRLSLDRWVVGTAGTRVKLDFAEGAFSNRDLWSYDPLFDVAAIADELDAAEEVRAEWVSRTGQPVTPSRWLLLRLVHAWDRHRLGGLPQPQLGRAYTAALTDFIADLFLADQWERAAPPAGPWCSLDIDGVLETGVFSQATAPGLDGASALRALVAHDYRVILATGRGADEVARRVDAWRLPGAAAEYGAVIVLEGGSRLDLRDTTSIEAVERARAWLATREEVTVDPGLEHVVRAWRQGPDSHRQPLIAADIAGANRAADDALVMIPGDDQTDLVPRGVSKALAVQALIDRLEPSQHQEAPLAFAAGDGIADTPMLGLAKHAVVPSHADPAVRAAATISVRGAYQAGLRQGVGGLLGHEPGGCARCHVSLNGADRALLTALSVREAGPRGIPRRVARLHRQVRTVR